MNRRADWQRYLITIVLIAVNVVIFLYMFVTGKPESSAYMVAHGAMYPELIAEKGEYYRLLAAAFLHFDMRHLASNMLLLGAAGRYVEEALGRVKFILLYLLAGVGGNLLSYGLMQCSGEYAVAAGASGAIFGLLGALLWIVLLHHGHYASLTGKGIAGMILLALYSGIAHENVDNMAHLGGLLAGFVLVILLYRRKKPGKSIF